MLFWSISKKFTPPKKFKCKPFSLPWWKFSASKFLHNKGSYLTEIALKMVTMLPIWHSSSSNCRTRQCKQPATLKWIPPVPTTSWRISASWWRYRTNHSLLWLWIPNPNRFKLINRKYKNHYLIKQIVIYSEEETTIWQIFFRTWCPSNSLRIGIKERWTSQWSPITTRWTSFKPFRAWALCSNSVTETTTVTRTPYYCSSCSKRSETKITQGQTLQTCNLFPASSNLHCSSKMRAFSNKRLSRRQPAQPSMEFWPQEMAFKLSSPRWLNQSSLLTTSLQSPTRLESPQREMC